MVAFLSIISINCKIPAPIAAMGYRVSFGDSKTGVEMTSLIEAFVLFLLIDITYCEETKHA